TSGAENVYAIEVDGDFDDCQAMLKALFADKEFAARAQLSAVNTINWARIVAQTFYYHAAAAALSAPGPVHFAVPSGNFGDGLAGFVAKRMGAKIGKIILATNANDILARALQTGRYERAAQSKATISPAMDIQVASNFERLVFEALGRDGEHTRALYDAFAQSGGFDIPAPALAKMRETFAAAAVTDEETAEAMRNYADGAEGALICPHTAVAWHAVTKLSDADAPPNGPLVTLATAHPAKFPETVEAAAGARPMLPFRCADLFAREEKMDALPVDIAALKAFVQARARAWA
ncbi:MAG: threonine synthase, partial [Hyphomonadaceae bacterium]